MPRSTSLLLLIASLPACYDGGVAGATEATATAVSTAASTIASTTASSAAVTTSDAMVSTSLSESSGDRPTGGSASASTGTDSSSSSSGDGSSSAAETSTTAAVPIGCPCYEGEGPYCGLGVAEHVASAGCEVAALAGHEGDILKCAGGEWSVKTSCTAGCEVTAPGDADTCALPVCDCFVKEAWCGSGAAKHGLTLDPPCRVPLVPEHNNDILGCDGAKWIVKQACEKGCHEEMVGVADSCNSDSDYKLPYACNTSQTCSQANFGSSHQGSQAYAWDFAMAKGTPVHAARAGTIKYLEIRSPPGSQCYDPPGVLEACHNKANFIGVRHSDGTVALYMHLREMKVKKGDVVTQGQLIALSGNSGYTSGPHLHFQLQNDCGIWFCNSVPVSFADAPKLAKGAKAQSGNCP